MSVCEVCLDDRLKVIEVDHHEMDTAWGTETIVAHASCLGTGVTHKLIEVGKRLDDAQETIGELKAVLANSQRENRILEGRLELKEASP